MGKNNPICDESRLIVYESEEHCIRCDPKSSNQSHLCSRCVDYLEEEVDEPLKYGLDQPLKAGQGNSLQFELRALSSLGSDIKL